MSRRRSDDTFEDGFALGFRPGAPDACWLWAAGALKSGYGQVFGGGRKALAHRASYEIHRGPIPPGMVVLHACDNPACVNPAHLSIGTHADNVADKVAKGRAPRGEAIGSASLTADQVLEIRAIYAATPHVSPAKLGERFGVGPTGILKAATGATWAHLPGAVPESTVRQRGWVPRKYKPRKTKEAA